MKNFLKNAVKVEDNTIKTYSFVARNGWNGYCSTILNEDETQHQLFNRYGSVSILAMKGKDKSDIERLFPTVEAVVLNSRLIIWEIKGDDVLSQSCRQPRIQEL